MKRTFFLLLAVATLGAPAMAQESPESVATALTEALQTGDFEHAARLMAPDAIADFRDLIIQLAELDSSGEFAEALFDGDAPDDFDAVSPEQAFAGFMRVLMAGSPELFGMMSTMRVEVIGHVMEGDDLAHVVTRNQGEMLGVEYEAVDVVSVRLVDGQWRALLKQDLKMALEMMSGIAKGFAGENQ